MLQATFAFRADLLPCRGTLALLFLRATITNSSAFLHDCIAGGIVSRFHDSKVAIGAAGYHLEEYSSGSISAINITWALMESVCSW